MSVIPPYGVQAAVTNNAIVSLSPYYRVLEHFSLLVQTNYVANSCALICLFHDEMPLDSDYFVDNKKRDWKDNNAMKEKIKSDKV